MTIAAALIQSPRRKRGVSPTRAQHPATRSLALGALIGFCVRVGAPSGIQSKWSADFVTDSLAGTEVAR